MRIYIASEYRSRPEAQALAEQVRLLGHFVTATWLDGQMESEAAGEQAKAFWRRRDLLDVGKSDALVIFTRPRGEVNTNGRVFEAGWFSAKTGGGPIFVIGPDENIFLDTMAEEKFPTSDKFIDYLRTNRRAR